LAHVRFRSGFLVEPLPAELLYSPKRVPAFQSKRRITNPTPPTTKKKNSTKVCIGPNNASNMLLISSRMGFPSYASTATMADFRQPRASAREGTQVKRQSQECQPRFSCTPFTGQEYEESRTPLVRPSLPCSVSSKLSPIAEDAKLAERSSSMICCVMRMRFSIHLQHPNRRYSAVYLRGRQTSVSQHRSNCLNGRRPRKAYCAGGYLWCLRTTIFDGSLSFVNDA